VAEVGRVRRDEGHLAVAVAVTRATSAVVGTLLVLAAVVILVALPWLPGESRDNARPPGPAASLTPTTSGRPVPGSDPAAVATVAALGTAFVSGSSSKPGGASSTAVSPRSAAPGAMTSPSPAPSPGLAQPAPAPSAAGRALLDEHFDDNQRGWPDDPQATAWLAGGDYLLFARYPSRFVAMGAPLVPPIGDAIVSGTFRKLGGPVGGGYGLIVRDQPPGPRDGLNQNGRFIVFEAGDNGEFGVWRREGNTWVDLIPWTVTNVVRTGLEPNELMVILSGTTLTFLANGSLLAEVTETSWREGGVGVFAETSIRSSWSAWSCRSPSSMHPCPTHQRTRERCRLVARDCGSS